MIRKTLIAAAALGAMAIIPTAASAKHFGHGGFHGGHGWRGGYGFTVLSPAVSCLQYRWVETRRGMRRILVDVCN